MKIQYMKKTTLLLIAAGVLSLTSCINSTSYRTKECRCYDLVGSHWNGPSSRMTYYDSPCASLNNSRRVCNEYDDPIIDPNDIGVDFK